MSNIIEWMYANLTEKNLMLALIIVVVIMCVCWVIMVVSLDRDNKEMWLIIEGILKEKKQSKSVKNDKNSDFQK